VISKVATAAGITFVPAVAGAAVGESPRFSVFGLIGDGTSYSEGAAYGIDQSTKLYSPYSVYDDGTNAIYDKENDEYVSRKKAVIAETKIRLGRLPGYIAEKKWYEVRNELNRYMGVTRDAMLYLAGDDKKKQDVAKAFFQAIEACDFAASRRLGDACSEAAAKSVELLDVFGSA